MNEDVARRPQPDLEAMARKNARKALLEHGFDPATIEQEITRFLAQPLLFEIPSDEELKALDASQ